MTAIRSVSRRSFERTLASAKRTMVLSEIVSLAIDSFRTNKVRVMLTSLGMVIGSASLILVFTIGLTGKQYILRLIEAIGTNMVEVEYSGGGPGSTAQHDFRTDYLTRADETAVLEQVPSVAYSSPMLQMHDRVAIGNGVSKDILVLGVSPQYRQVRNLILIAGRFFDEEDDASHAKVAVVTEPFARQKFGTINAVDQTFEIKGIPFTVIGTFKEAVDTLGQTEVADQTILIPYSVARYFTGTNDIKKIFFSIRDTGDVELATKQILQVIHSRHQPNSVYDGADVDRTAEYRGGDRQCADPRSAPGIVRDSCRRRHRDHEHHAGERTFAHPGDRHPQGAGGHLPRNKTAVPHRGGVHFAERRRHRYHSWLGRSLLCRLFTSYRIPISGLSAIIALAAATLVGVVFGTLPATRAAQLDPVESLKFE